MDINRLDVIVRVAGAAQLLLLTILLERAPRTRRVAVYFPLIAA